MWATGDHSLKTFEEDAARHMRIAEHGYECHIRMLRTRLGDMQEDLTMARGAIRVHEQREQRRNTMCTTPPRSHGSSLAAKSEGYLLGRVQSA